MKNLLAILLLVITNLTFAQDYKQKLSKSSCDCLKTIDTSKDQQTITSQLGLCMLKTAMPYSKEIKRDYNIDLTKDISNNEKMRELGIQMGMIMLSECQELFMKMTGSKKEEVEDVSDESSYLLISGTLKKIEKDNFVIFHIVGENNNLTKFYWVSNIESNLDLPKEYNSLLNKKVNVSYYTTEIFDVKINDYRNLNVISSLKTD